MEQLKQFNSANDPNSDVQNRGSQRKKRRLLDPYMHPTSLIHKDPQNVDNELQRPLRISMQHKEIQQEKSLNNYQKYLKRWDKYERQIKLHFEEKELA